MKRFALNFFMNDRDRIVIIIQSNLFIYILYSFSFPFLRIHFCLSAESNINVVGNVFSFVATKYPTEWYWKLVKVSRVWVHGHQVRHWVVLEAGQGESCLGSWPPSTPLSGTGSWSRRVMFSFVATKYPTEWYWKLVKVSHVQLYGHQVTGCWQW